MNDPASRPRTLRRVAFRVVTVVLAFSATYLFAELLLAPWLHERFGLFAAAYFARDVDHRLPANDPRIPTNSDGIRSRRQAEEFVESGTNVVLLGDSFVFGYGLTVEQSIPSQVERRLRERFPGAEIKVANFGWVSSSPLLDERLLRDVGDRYRPDVIALCIDMADFHDDLVYGRMLESVEVHRALSRFPLFVTAMRELAPAAYGALLDRLTGVRVPARPYFMTLAPLDRTRPYTRALMGNVQKIRDYARAHAAAFVLFVFPRYFQYDAREAPHNWERGQYDLDGAYNLEPFRFFAEQQERVDYPIYSLLETFRETEVFPTCFENDPHWNEAGAAVAAEAIAERLAPWISATLAPP